MPRVGLCWCAVSVVAAAQACANDTSDFVLPGPGGKPCPAGYDYIATQEECERAADILSKSFEGAEGPYSDGDHPPCFSNPNAIAWVRPLVNKAYIDDAYCPGISDQWFDLGPVCVKKAGGCWKTLNCWEMGNFKNPMPASTPSPPAPAPPAPQPKAVKKGTNKKKSKKGAKVVSKPKATKKGTKKKSEVVAKKGKTPEGKTLKGKTPNGDKKKKRKTSKSKKDKKSKKGKQSKKDKKSKKGKKSKSKRSTKASKKKKGRKLQGVPIYC